MKELIFYKQILVNNNTYLDVYTVYIDDNTPIDEIKQEKVISQGYRLAETDEEIALVKALAIISPPPQGEL